MAKKDVLASEQLETLATAKEGRQETKDTSLTDNGNKQARLSMTLDISVGGKFYSFYAGKVYSVPSTVYTALQRRGALTAL